MKKPIVIKQWYLLTIVLNAADLLPTFKTMPTALSCWPSEDQHRCMVPQAVSSCTYRISSVWIQVPQDTLCIQTCYPVFSRVRGAWILKRIEKSHSTLATQCTRRQRIDHAARNQHWSHSSYRFQAIKSLPDPGVPASHSAELQGRGWQDLDNTRIEGEPLIYTQFGYKLLWNWELWSIYREAADPHQSSLGLPWKRLRNTVGSELITGRMGTTKAYLDNTPWD